MRDTEYIFRPAEMMDVALIRTWQNLPHVREWWGDDGPFDEDELRDTRVSRWIVELNGKPLAYMQDYSVHGWEDNHFWHLPSESRGIDQYIGDPEMIGRGHGTAFIRQRMHEMFSAGVPVIGLCCTNRVRDSSRESSVVAGMHEQTYTPNLQNQELASLQ